MATRRHFVAAGFTLVETLGVCVLIGLLAALAGMSVFGLYSAGQDKQAIAAAQTINQAQQIYLLRVSGSATAWSNAGSDDAKFNLLQSYLPGTPTSLETFEPNGYTFTLGANLTDPVKITDSKGNNVD
jgi:type II secretory pathway pseudopilin PulG